MITNINETLQEMKLVYNWSNGTQTLYKTAWNNYIKFHNKSFPELINEAELDEETIHKASKRKIKKRLIQYRLHLQNENKTPNTIKMYLAVITKVYKYYDIEIPDTPPIRAVSTETFADIPTIDEITQAINHSRTKMKALITFIVSSGLRRSDVANLTINDFITATKEYHNEEKILPVIAELQKQEMIIPTWNIRSQKTKINHITFSSDESTKYMIQMLKERILKEDIHNEDSLFNIKADTISKNFRTLNEKLEYGWKETRRHFHPHSLRKYFATTLTSNDLSYLDTQFLLGHHLSKVDSSYYFCNSEKLKNKYISLLDHLTFTQEVIIKNVGNDKEFEELKQFKSESIRRINQLEEMIHMLNKEHDVEGVMKTTAGSVDKKF